MGREKITKLDLHLKDYDKVREDVDGIIDWAKWGSRIIFGTIILAVLVAIGISK